MEYLAQVHDKLKMNLEKSKNYLNKYEQMLYKITRLALADDVIFENESNDFKLTNNPFSAMSKGNSIPLGKYRMGSPNNRQNHPLAQCLIETLCTMDLPIVELKFDYRSHSQKIASIDNLVDKTGWLSLYKKHNVPALLEILTSRFSKLEGFERKFPSLCFALATGVGKTR